MASSSVAPQNPKGGENRKETESSQSAMTKQDTWGGCYGVCVAGVCMSRVWWEYLTAEPDLWMGVDRVDPGL